MGGEKMEVVIIGSGFAGSVIARKLVEHRQDIKVTIYEKRNHIGGNMYDEVDENGVLIQKYGPHIFHTNSKEIFEFIGCFTEYRYFKHEVVGKIDGEIVPIPFNFAGIDILFTLEAATNIKKLLMEKYEVNQRVSIGELLNSQNGTIRSFGEYVYEKVFVHYTEKQWGIPINEIDAAVINRIPVVMGYETNHFSTKYQYMPKEGFKKIFDNMLNHPRIQVFCNVNAKNILCFNEEERQVYVNGKKFEGPIIMTGALDELLDYKYGVLPYRSLDLKYEKYKMNYFQTKPVVNYPNSEEFTRITEFKYLTGQKIDNATTILKEYPCAYNPKKNIPFYPIVNEDSYSQYEIYKEYFEKFRRFYLCGRLAEYKYYDMNSVIVEAMKCAKKIIEENC